MSQPPSATVRRRAAPILAVALLVGACATPVASPSSAPSTTPTPSPTAAATATPVPTATPIPTATPTPAPVPKLALAAFAKGLDHPVDLAGPNDSSGRLFVAEQTGRVRILQDGVLQDGPYLDLHDRVSYGGEQGLLGIALHPDFPNDPRIFVDYTDPDGDTVVSSFDGSLDADSADPESERVILQVKQPYPNHNGGALVFGPDGMLYIALGDGGSGGDPEGNGRNLGTHLAKILRVDIDVPDGQQRGYDIPPDNPWADGANGALPENWLTGLRNPWRIRFDDDTGDLWIGDVGQSEWEEIDVVRAGQQGLDFGWNIMEGFHCYNAETCDRAGLTLPVAEYGHDLGCAVVGGVVMHDATLPALEGRYVFADDCSGRLWTIAAATTGKQTPLLGLESKRQISSISSDSSGAVYALDLGRGEVLRVTAATP